MECCLGEPIALLSHGRLSKPNARLINISNAHPRGPVLYAITEHHGTPMVGEIVFEAYITATTGLRWS